MSDVLHHFESVVAREILGVLLTSWPRMLVFLRLMVRPNTLQACAKELMSLCKALSVCPLAVLSEPWSLLGDVQG